MKHGILFLVLSSCAVPDASPKPARPMDSERREAASEAPPRPALAKRAETLVELGLREGQAHAMLGELTTAAPHRLSGSAGAARAVEWAREKMIQLGLSNVRLEKVVVPRWVRGDVADARIVSPEVPGELGILALGGSIGTGSAGITGEVVMVRSFDQLRQLGAERCAGKIVFFNRPMPRALVNTFQAYGSSVPQRTGGAVVAAKVGAKAVIVRSMTTSIDDVPHTGAMRYEKGTPEIPAAAISTKGAERIAKLIKAGKTVRMHLRMDCESHPDVESANVVGELVGSDRPDEIVVIGGHLDCWDVGQGAHDDGAGVTHCLEAVRLLQAASIPPKRTIRVVLFMNEENGLRGANAYVAAHFAELSRHVAAIESDRGGFEPKGFTSSLRGEALESLRRLVAPLRAYGMGALIPGGGGADVGRLGPHGVVLFGLIPSSHRYFDYHHSERDRIEMVNERELELGAAAVAYLASVLADHFEPERSSR